MVKHCLMLWNSPSPFPQSLRGRLQTSDEESQNSQRFLFTIIFFKFLWKSRSFRRGRTWFIAVALRCWLGNLLMFFFVRFVFFFARQWWHILCIVCVPCTLYVQVTGLWCRVSNDLDVTNKAIKSWLWKQIQKFPNTSGHWVFFTLCV